jgi:hypothetical protein
MKLGTKLLLLPGSKQGHLVMVEGNLHQAHRVKSTYARWRSAEGLHLLS